MRFEEITSKDNAKIKLIAKLIHSVKERNKSGLFVIEGARLCSDAYQSGVKIKWLMFTENARVKYEKYISPIAEQADANYLLSETVFGKIADTESTQGVLCVCEKPTEKPVIKYNGKYVAVENVSNPSNLGAIARTAEALGLDGMMLLGNGCDAYSEKALRASMGSLLRLDLLDIDYADIELLREHNMTFYASVVDADAKSVIDVDFTDGSVMIIGNEGNGITEKLKAMCNGLVTIPISGKAESFNAAAAAAILLWEFVK